MAVLSALGKHKSNVDVAVQGNWAIAGLALSTRNQKIIAREHGIKAVLDTMKANAV